MLIDLPGIRDLTAARSDVTIASLEQVDHLWIVTNGTLRTNEETIKNFSTMKSLIDASYNRDDILGIMTHLGQLAKKINQSDDYEYYTESIENITKIKKQLVKKKGKRISFKLAYNYQYHLSRIYHLLGWNHFNF